MNIKLNYSTVCTNLTCNFFLFFKFVMGSVSSVLFGGVRAVLAMKASCPVFWKYHQGNYVHTSLTAEELWLARTLAWGVVVNFIGSERGQKLGQRAFRTFWRVTCFKDCCLVCESRGESAMGSLWGPIPPGCRIWRDSLLAFICIPFSQAAAAAPASLLVGTWSEMDTEFCAFN